jgi:hypothetical protein
MQKKPHQALKNYYDLVKFVLFYNIMFISMQYSCKVNYDVL